MPAWDDDVKNFMTYWFAGFVDGLSGLDEPARQRVLRACGKACARSYTAEVFRRARQSSPDLPAFLAALAASFPEAAYELVSPSEIRVRLARCACDLVVHGLVTSPLLCDCSAQNLETNFSEALGEPVEVTLETSILRGADRCAFTVKLGRPASGPA
jgi:hypothetical protein